MLNDSHLSPTPKVCPHLSPTPKVKSPTPKVLPKVIGLDKAAYGTHSMRRTKASIIYREMKNLRAIQVLLGHSKIDRTIRYLGVKVDDALDLAERIQV